MSPKSACRHYWIRNHDVIEVFFSYEDVSKRCGNDRNGTLILHPGSSHWTSFDQILSEKNGLEETAENEIWARFRNSVQNVISPIKAIELTDEERAKMLQIVQTRIKKRLNLLWDLWKPVFLDRFLDPSGRWEEKISVYDEQADELAEEILNSHIAQWFIDGSFDQWIAKACDNRFDKTFEFQTEDEVSRFNDLMGWLWKENMTERSGCYCFLENQRYLYVGQSDSLGNRLKGYERQRYLTYATHVRLISCRSSKLDQLETLLISRHIPIENKNGGRGYTDFTKRFEQLREELEAAMNSLRAPC